MRTVSNQTICHVQLVNLARLGNTKVTEKYNLKLLYDAAIQVTKITTGELPHGRTEVYGAQGKKCWARDCLFH